MQRAVSRRKQKFNSAAAKRLMRLAGERVRTVDHAIDIVTTRLLDSVTCPPTDLEAVATRVGVKSFDTADIPYPGELRELNDGFQVVTAEGLPEGRRRFTIAHELAHAVFKETGARWPRVGEELEELCDMIAVELLMPASVFAQHLTLVPSIDEIRTLAGIFRVSLLAAGKRCSEFRPVAIFEVNERKVTSGCRFVRTGAKHNELVPDIQTAISDALGGQRVAREGDVYYRRCWIRQFIEAMPTTKGKRALVLIRQRPS